MRIKSIGAALPSKEVTNESLIAEIIDRSRKHIPRLKLRLVETLLRQAFVKSGTKTRYVRDNGERAIDLSLRAGREALAKADMQPEEIDLLIYTGVGRGWLEPAMATLFQSELELNNATCFDVLDACASWMRSLCIAQSFIDNGTYRNIMILNSEFNNKEHTDLEIKNPSDLNLSFAQFTLGEAATATILSADGNKSNFYFTFKTWGEMHDLCQVPLPNASEYFPLQRLANKKNGTINNWKPMVFFSRSTELLGFAVEKLATHFTSDSYLSSRAYDIIFGHDASEYSTEMALKKMNVDPGLAIRTHSRFGNTVSATIPLALSTAIAEEKLRSGMEVLLICGSAGVSTAFCSFSY
ncbi:MAG: hypothetical protein KDD69_13000 [Bdellovibrionales bacterium]|nr:hypothetical protein [Bdellovibrionales bacterium]